MRWQMYESNHEIVNMLIQQIDTVFNPLVQNTNQSYELLDNQMGQIVDFFDAPRVQVMTTLKISNSKQVESPDNGQALVNQGQ